MIKNLPFNDNHQNICYIFENSKNSYYDFYVEIRRFANDSEKYEIEEKYVNKDSIVENGMIAFKQHYLSKNSAFWASFLGPSYAVGCSVASYDLFDVEVVEHNGMYCYFKTIEENFDDYFIGKGCSLCQTECSIVYNHLCN